MGCLISKEENHSPPLSTRAIYSLIFSNNYIDKDKERSKSDSEVSYKISYSPESDVR
jgi:hypothetical protein